MAFIDSLDGKSGNLPNRENAYRTNPEFWDKTGFKVIGDWLGRKPAIDLLGDLHGKIVLETGCASGFVARLLAEPDRGAKEIHACDKISGGLQNAIAKEREHPMGIQYAQAKIDKLPFKDNVFDKILSTGVLIHDTEEEVINFLKEAHRALKPGGELVISITHPELFETTSPSRTGKAVWLSHRPMEQNVPLSKSQRFEEDYLDNEGKNFPSVVWHHPKSFFIKSLKDAGFEIEHEQSIPVTEDVLRKSFHWGSISGYNAYWQIKVRAIKQEG